MASRSAERVVAVGGGKGGVGKSVIAVNLAIAMAQRGRRVVLVDGDLGAANLHTLLGIERPGLTLEALFTRQVATLDEALHATRIDNLRLLPGTTSQVGAANITHAHKVKLLRQIRALDAEVVVLDVGAGVAFNTLDLFDVADLRVLVTTPQLTAIQNAYAFLKGALLRALRPCAHGPAQAALFEAAAGNGVGRIEALLARAGAEDPRFRARLEQGLGGFRASLIGNLVHQRSERNVFHAVARMVKDFLGLEVPVLGVLWNERTLHDSVTLRTPLLATGADTDAARSLRQMALALLEEPISRQQPGAEEPHGSQGSQPSQSSQASEEERALQHAAAVAQAQAHAPALQHHPDSLPALQAMPAAPPVLELAEALAVRERQHPRHPAMWRGTLVGNGASFPVLVREISLAGALLDASAPLEVETRWELLFDHLLEVAPVPLVVRATRTGGRRAGVEFTLPPEELPERLRRAIDGLRTAG
jgi:flagellar biosynthesis protein FlhG